MAGGKRLAGFLDGFHAARGSQAPQTATVMGGVGRDDPRVLGVAEFSAEGDGTFPGVTEHDALTEDGIGYLTPGSNSLRRMVKIITSVRA